MPTSVLRALYCLVLCCVILLGICSHSLLLFSSPQSVHARQTVRAVLSQAVLTPALRSPEATLRFSPNGKYLLLQDASGVTILSTTPLKIVFYVAAAGPYSPPFSPASPKFFILSVPPFSFTLKLAAPPQNITPGPPLSRRCPVVAL